MARKRNKGAEAAGSGAGARVQAPAGSHVGPCVTDPAARLAPGSPPLRRVERTARWRGLGLAAALALGCGHVGAVSTPVVSRDRGGVTLIRPRCVGARSCLVGQVVSAEGAAPLPRAAVFLVREGASSGKAAARAPTRLAALTDDQGVFTITDAPAGVYRLAVYKDARWVEARGVELGAPGVTVVPVRLPP